MAGSAGVTSAEGSLGGNVSIEREVVTEAGNRIDVLLTSDSHAVLTENKIHAAVANPFGDYSGYLDGLKNENGEAYVERAKVLLTRSHVNSCAFLTRYDRLHGEGIPIEQAMTFVGHHFRMRHLQFQPARQRTAGQSGRRPVEASLRSPVASAQKKDRSATWTIPSASVPSLRRSRPRPSCNWSTKDRAPSAARCASDYGRSDGSFPVLLGSQRLRTASNASEVTGLER